MHLSNPHKYLRPTELRATAGLRVLVCENKKTQVLGERSLAMLSLLL